MYAIMRIEKRKRSAVFGLQIEANRTAADRAAGDNKKREFVASDIDWSRTQQNYYFRDRHCFDWNKQITATLKGKGIKPRKDAIVLIDGLYTASPEFFKGKSRDEIIDYFKECLAFHEAHYGKCINAVIHFDEATPHMHCQSIPLTKDNRLSAFEILGTKKDYHKRQNDFYEQVAKDRGFDRCKRSDPYEKRKHLSVQDFKIQQAEAKLEALSTEYEAMKQELLKCRTELSEVKKQALEIALESFTKKMIAYLSSDDITISDGKRSLSFKEFFKQNWESYKSKHFPDIDSPDIGADESPSRGHA